MQTRAFSLVSPQPALSSSSSSSMSSSLVVDRSREKPKRKKRLNLPPQYNQESETHSDPSFMDCSDLVNISSKHKGRKNRKSKIPLPLNVSPKRPSYLTNQSPLWQESAVVDSGFGGSPYGHLNHWQGMSPCNTSVHSLASVEQEDREEMFSKNFP